MSFKWLEVAKQIQSIAQAGLTFSENKYDLERYEILRELSVRILNEFTDGEEHRLRELFATERGYQTPKLDVRGVVIREDKILLVHETIDDKWSIPGGWCEVGLSPRENVEKEVYEESGLVVEASRLLAVFDKNYHNHPPDMYHSYKLIILCKEKGGTLKSGMETQNTGFFSMDELPPLSIERITSSQIEKIFQLVHNSEGQSYFD